MKTRLTPPEIRDYRAHMRKKTLPARSLQQHVHKKLAQHAIKRLFSAIFRSLGELFRAHARIKASQGEFAHRTQRPGDAETNNTTAHPRHGTAETAIPSAHPQQGTTETDDTSAPEKCAKNAHFSPAKAMAVSDEARHARAKAMAVSTPHRYKRAKAMAVLDKRAAWPPAPSTPVGPGVLTGGLAPVVRCSVNSLEFQRLCVEA